MDRTTTSPVFIPMPICTLSVFGLSESLTVALQLFLHRQSRIAGAQGVIFVRQRRAEQRHDAVAQDLIDGAFVPVHCVHHQVQYRIDDFLRFFRIAPFDECGRAANVGEQRPLRACARLRARAGWPGFFRLDAWGRK